MTSFFTRVLFAFVLCVGLVTTGLAKVPLRTPSAVQSVPIDPKRYVLFWLYHYSDVNIGYANLGAAFDAGCNVALLGVNWDEIVAKSGATPNWTVIDELIRFSLARDAKVALRIVVSRDYRMNEGFWLDEHRMRDNTGKPLVTSLQTLFSFSHEPSVSKAQDFVRAVTQRYQYLQASGKLLFMSVVFSPPTEADYPLGNNDENGISQAAPFDYSQPTQSAYRQWLMSRYNNNIAELNRVQARAYANFESITPPQPDGSPFAVFGGKAGEDWYVFRHQVMKSFMDKSIATIHSVNANIPVVNEHGSCFDIMSGLRGTFAIKDLSKMADGLKINDAPEYDHFFSTDVSRTSIGPNKLVFSEVDGINTSLDLQVLYDQAEQSYRNGSNGVTFANFNTAANWARMKWVIQKLKANGILDQPVTRPTPTATFSYKLSDMVHGGVDPGEMMRAYQQVRSAAGNQPINVNVIEDLLGETVAPAPTNKPPVVTKPTGSLTMSQGVYNSLTISTGNFSDPDGQISSFGISGLPTGVGFNQDGTTLFLAGTPTTVGTSRVVLTATDNRGASVSDTFSLIVSVPPVSSNKPPTVVRPVGSLTMTQGTYSSLTIPTGNFADPDGQITGFSISGLPAGVSFNRDGASLFVAGTPAVAATSRVILVATDNAGASVADTFSLLVKPPAVVPPPPATGTSSLTMSYNAATLTITVSGSLKGAAKTAMRLHRNGVNVQNFYDNRPGADCGASLVGPFAPGTYTAYAFEPDNDPLNLTSNAIIIEAPTVPANKPPVVTKPVGSLTLIQGTYGSRVIPTSNFSDPDGTITNYGISGLPLGVGFNQDGASLFVAGTPAVAGTSRVILTATDNRGASVSDTFSLIVKVPVVVPLPTTNKPPTVVTAIGSQTVTQGVAYSRTIPLGNFADSDGRIVRVEASGLPAGLTYDQPTRVLSGTPTATGTSAIRLLAVDDGGASVADTLRLTVVGAVVRPPVVVTKLANQTAVQGQSFSLAIPATNFADPVGQIASIGVTGLPGGLTYSANTGRISGTPSLTGISSVIVTATNDRGASVSDTFRLTVLEPVPNRPPTVANPIPDQVATQNQSFTLVIPSNTFADADGQVVSVAVSGLPLGLTYQTGNQTISGLPALLGVSTITVTATDNRGATVSTSFQLTVRTVQPQGPNKPPVVSKTITNQVAYAGKSYSLTIPPGTFTDPDGTITGIGVAGLPVGLSYETTTRAISGRPVLLGTSVVTVTAFDDRKASVATTFLLTVRDVPSNQPPTLVRQLAPQSAVLGAVFSMALGVNDFADADGEVVSVSVSGLPTGLTYSATNALISGIPTQAGTYTIGVTATDNLGAATGASFKLTVGALDTRLVLFGNAGKTSRAVVDNDAIDINTLPQLVNAYADTDSKTGSIAIDLSGPVTRSAVANGGVCTLYAGQDGFKPVTGRYTVNITIYAGPDKTGAVLLTRTIRFDVLLTGG